MSTKTLKQQLVAAARKWSESDACGDDRAFDAFVNGAKWWQTNSRKAVRVYEKEMTDALEDRNGKVSPWEKLQIRKTARLWYNRDRLADELDMEDSFMRTSIGSMKQLTETVDQRLTLLEKFDRTLTADLSAIGLNYNANPKRIVEPTRVDETEQGRLSKKLSELMG